MTPDEINVLCAEFMEAKPTGFHSKGWWRVVWIEEETPFLKSPTMGSWSHHIWVPARDVTTDLNAGMEVAEKMRLIDPPVLLRVCIGVEETDENDLSWDGTWYCEIFRPHHDLEVFFGKTPPDALARALGAILGEGK